jgi:hypothetical protein
LITTGGGALGTILAAGAITLAGKVASLFDSSVELNPRGFIQVIAGLLVPSALSWLL